MLLARCIPVRPHRQFVPLLAALAAAAYFMLPGSAAAAFTEQTVLWGVASGDSMSYGASFVDFDGDGDDDFYVNNHWKGPADFYRNDGAVAPMTDFSAHFGTENSDRHDNLWADFNNDGSPDHYIIHGRTQENELWWNLGAGILVEGAVAANADDQAGRGREITLADFNFDGYLDIFIVNDFRAGFPKPCQMLLNTGNETFSKFPNVFDWFEARTHVSSCDYDMDGDPDLFTTNPPFNPGELWRNEGTGFFTNVTASAFLGIPDPLLQANGLSWADYDSDGDLDLFTASGNRAMWDYVGLESDSLRWYAECEPGETKTLFVFTDGDSVTLTAGLDDYQPVTLYEAATGAASPTFPITRAIADLATEPPELGLGLEGAYLWSVPGVGGDSVFVVANQDSAETTPYLAGGSVRANGSGILGWGSTGFEAPPGFSQGNFTNRLYRNEGNTRFTEVTSTAFAVNDSTVSSLTGSWADYDNDGHIDLYVTNSGNVEVGNSPNYLYRNNGDGTFTEVAAAEGVQGSDRGLGDGAAWGDLNGDGFPELFVDNGAEHPLFGVGPRQMFQNMPNGNHWIKFDLRGIASNGSGVGAFIRIVTPTGKQWRWMQGETDNCFANTRTLHFGLGAHTSVDTVEVTWPSGQVDTYANVSADASYWLVEGDSIRDAGTQQLVLGTNSLNRDVNPNEVYKWEPVALTNPGGGAVSWSAHTTDCSGAPIPWLTTSPDAGGVWPATQKEISITVDASFLSVGPHCARVILTSTSTAGPDTIDVSVTVLPPSTDAPELGGTPGSFALGVPRPNPSRDGSRITLSLPATGHVRASIHDVGGRRVAWLVDHTLPAGSHELFWPGREESGRRAPAGVYFLRAESAGERAARKLLLLD